MKKIFTLILVAMAAIATNAAVTFSLTVDDAVYTDYEIDANAPAYITISGTKHEMTKTGKGTFVYAGDHTGNLGKVKIGIGTINRNYTTNSVEGNDFIKYDLTYDDEDNIAGTTTIVNAVDNMTINGHKLYQEHAVDENGDSIPGARNGNKYVCSLKLSAEELLTLKVGDKTYGAATVTEGKVAFGDSNVYTAGLTSENPESFQVPDATTYYIEVTVDDKGVPTSILITEDSKTITAVNDVNAVKNVAGIRYYNLQGMQSATPFSGLNIMVTSYTDGTTATTKVIK